MEDQYARMARVFRALSNPKRIRIFEMLSGGEMCACVLLEHFHVTQPTLSHDMKTLIDAGIVVSRRDGQRTYYSLDRDALGMMQNVLRKMICPEVSATCP